MVSQFVIRFQNLQLQISRPIPEEELKDFFLEAICEPLRTTLAVFDFRNQSLEQVVDKAMAMDQTHNNTSMNMSALHQNLPTLEELIFRQIVQCTSCLNTGHSKAHSVEQCEYNLLNKTTAPVWQIHPEMNYQENRNQSQDNDRSR